MGQISDIHIPPVNYVLEKGITYIHSFHCILYKLNHCTHTHTPLLFHLSEVTEF